jgi:SET domain-containing protein
MFAADFIPAGHHIIAARIGDKRTPAGCLTNHSAAPNAKAVQDDGGDVNFWSTEDIHAGIEITLDYRQVHAESRVRP